jgi:antimicrobial peptide system SdpA family protein
MLSNRKKKFIFLNIFIWMFFGIVLLVGAMPKTPLMINDNIKKNISIIFPNRWPFFTKDPREEYVYIFQKKSQGHTLHPNLPNSSFANFYGMINTQRAIGMEYGMISSQIDENLWYTNNTGKNLLKIIDNDTIKTIKLKRDVKYTELKGEYIFVKIEPLPYLWKNKVNQLEMPSKFVKIIIE